MKKNIKRKEIKKQRKKSNHDLKLALSFFPYVSIMEDGICNIDNENYSIMLEFDDINYSSLDRQEQYNLFAQYAVVLNAVTSKEGITLFTQNTFVQDEDIQNNFYYQYSDRVKDEIVDSLNEIVKKSYVKGDNAIITKRYFIITEKAEDENKAIKILNNKAKDLIHALSGINSSARVLTGLERLRVIKNVYAPQEELLWDYTSNNTNDEKLAICPTAIIAPKMKKYLQLSSNGKFRYSSTLYLKSYAKELSDDMLSKLQDIKGDISISCNYKVWDDAEAQSMIRTVIAQMQQQMDNARRKAASKNIYLEYEDVGGSIHEQYKDAKSFLEDLVERDQRLFSVQLLIGISADSLEDLQMIEDEVKLVGKKYSCKFDDLLCLEEEGFKSIIPIGTSTLKQYRNLSTENVATFMPFRTKELNESLNFIHYGINASSNNLIRVNRRNLTTASGFVLGPPGTGKSVCCKKEITSIKTQYKNADIVVIDPHREYGALSDELGGVVIKMDSSSDAVLNVMEMSKKQELDDKCSFLRGFLATIAGDGEIDAKMFSILKRTLNKLYLDHENKKEQNKNIEIDSPTLKDLFTSLKENEETQAKDLALILESFVTGKNKYSGQTNVNLNSSNFIVFDLRDTSKVEKPITMHIILESLWNKIIYNFENGKATWVFVDEAHLMMSNKYAREMWEDFFKAGRKFGAIFTLITQNVSTFINNIETQTLLANSQWVIMLKQSEEDKNILKELFHISDSQCKYITNNPKGTGLIFSGGNIVPFEDIIPSNSPLFKLFSTTPTF